MRTFAFLLSIICGVGLMFSAPLSYSGSIPAEGNEISSFEDITLLFNFDGVIEEHGDGEWGICVSSTYSPTRPEKNKIAALYKGAIEDGEMLGYIAETIKASGDNFKVGNELHLSFPSIPIETGQLYTLKVTYDLYAGRVSDGNSWTTATKLSFFNDPLVLTFYGSSETNKVLTIESNSIDENTTYEQIPEVKVSFNYDVTVNNNMSVEVYEGSEEVVASSTIFVDSEDTKSIIIKFPETALYNGHSYNIVIPAGIVSVAEEEDVVNQVIEMPIKGASYRFFGIGRVRPSSGSETVMDEITIPFKFPTADDKTYGFVNVDNGNKKWYLHIYEGATADGEEILSVAATKIGDDNQSLIFRPSYAFKPETEYTLVIPEGDVLAYEIGAPRETYLKDYISERVELHYTTPSIEVLPTWTPAPVNMKNGDEVAELKNFIIDRPVYEYDGATYGITFGSNGVPNGVLYLITENGEQEIKTFRVSGKNLTAESEIGNGELVGFYYIGEVNETLYEGNEYRLVLPANSYVVNNTFIGQYIGNPEISVILKGATPTVNDFGLKANVDDRLHSHADVFSFVTESEVKAGENAKMILKDGEENVAEAPIYVSREANGHRVYADFGGKKLESGKSYDVVLPEGSVYATNGIVNNPEIKSAITAMPEAPAAPEFVSIALNIDEYASATYRMVKGQESVLNLKAGDDWKLESLSLNGDDVTSDVDENGLYTLPALDEDAKLDAAYTYAREINYDFETGVGNIQDVPYSLSKDGSHLLISGLKGGEQIAIYTVGGMKIASLDAVPADMHEASLALPEGQVYIILINGTSIKWKH